jgi:hypothetical protein
VVEIRVATLAGVLVIGPTSLDRGEGPFSELSRVVEGGRVARAKVVVVGWVEDERISTVMGLI